eukprot:gene13269-13400_t
MKHKLRALSAAEFHDPKLLKRAKRAPQCNAIEPSPQSSPLLPHHGCWKTFKTQAAAFEFVDSQCGVTDLRVFAEEISTTGQRVFIAASTHIFWQQYKQLKAAERHHYEIIREGQPCNLFFDLEFCPETNPCLDGPGLVHLLLNEVAAQLQKLYDISWDNSFALEFDSSTPQKFSRHLIIAVPGLAFADACHAGRFARMTLLELLRKGIYSSRPGQLLVQNKDASGLTSFVDMGVYTRNRSVCWAHRSSEDAQGPSVFPLLDQFIHSVCVQGGVQGSIRSWVMQPGSGCICFNMKDNRYCANVGRQHRSNGVYYVAEDALCWQILDQVEQEQMRKKQNSPQPESWQRLFASSSKVDDHQRCLQVM